MLREEGRLQRGKFLEPVLGEGEQALQLVAYKLASLGSHMATSRTILNDLRTLRRLLLEERRQARKIADL